MPRYVSVKIRSKQWLLKVVVDVVLLPLAHRHHNHPLPLLLLHQVRLRHRPDSIETVFVGSPPDIGMSSSVECKVDHFIVHFVVSCSCLYLFVPCVLYLTSSDVAMEKLDRRRARKDKESRVRYETTLA
jgi:hypothetical protein